jgi:WD40 repeat protein
VVTLERTVLGGAETVVVLELADRVNSSLSALSWMETSRFSQTNTGHRESVLGAGIMVKATIVLSVSFILCGVIKGSEYSPNFVLQSQHGAIGAVAFSPDGKIIVSGGPDGVAVVWDVESGRVVRRLVINGGNIQAIAFSDRNRVLIGANGISRGSTTSGKAIEVWNAATGKRLLEFGPDSQRLHRVAISEDGRFTLTTTDEQYAVWNNLTHRVITSFHGSDHPEIEELSFGLKGKSVLTGGGGVSATLWDLRTGHAINKYGKFYSQVFALAVSSDEKRIIVGWNTRNFGSEGFIGTPAVISIWDAATSKELNRFDVGETIVTSVAISPNGKQLIGGFGNGTFKMWDIATQRLMWTIGSFPSTFGNKAIFSPDGKKILTTAAVIGRLALLDSATGSILREIGGESDETKAVVFTANDLLITGNEDNSASIWDLASGRVSHRLTGHAATPYFSGVRGLAVSKDGRLLVTAGEDGTARLWDTETGAELHRLAGHKDGVFSVAISSDGKSIVTGSADRTAKLWTITGTEICSCLGHDGTVNSVAFAEADSEIVTGGSEGSLKVWSASDCHLLREILPESGFPSYILKEELPESNTVRTYTRGPKEIHSLSVFGDGEVVLVGTDEGIASVWRLKDRANVMVTPFVGASISSVTTAANGTVLITGAANALVTLWDANTARLHKSLSGETQPGLITTLSGHAEPITSVAIHEGGKLLAAASSDGTTIIWNYVTGRRLVTLASVTGSAWTVVSDEGGQFDAGELENMPSSWVFPDDPFRPLAPEIFMRDYYEPKLLPRLLTCSLVEQTMPDACKKEFKPVRPLETLNRVQPLVEVKAEWEDEGAGIAMVEVTVKSNREPGMKNGKTVAKPYDVRLFRDGQLVGWGPKTSVQWQLEPPPSGPDLKKNEELDLERWRSKTEIKNLGPGGSKELPPFLVQVPRRADLKQVTFTAYAFNEDRVKSATARATLTVDKPLQARMGKAYVISVGVNRTENSSAWKLNYAANDARQMSKVVGDKLEGTKQFSEVVRVRLVSDAPGKQEAGEAAATKAHLRTVLDVLAGRRGVNEQLKREIPDIGEVSRAEPEDMVLLTFSSHGYTDNRGVFHIVLWDIGKDTPQDKVTPELQGNSLSSDVLSGWLRDVDAGAMTMIVDACHSEATVAAEGFKPGPMGSRGLGQLAYDKGMRILAASKSNEEAMELGGNIKQGLLSYALVEEGLVEGKAAKDGKVVMSGWLNYGEQEVPNLYKVGKAKGPKGEHPLAPNGRDIIYLGHDQAPPTYQQPVLFDFAKQSDVLINSN